MSTHAGRRLSLPQALACMVVILAALLLAGCPAGPGPQNQGPLTEQQLVQKVKDAVVQVRVDMTAGDVQASMAGSGFAINDKGRLITNAHVVSDVIELEDGRSVVADSQKIEVAFHSGTDQEKVYPVQVVRQNPELDLALLKVDVPTPVFLELTDSDNLPELTPLLACGHPLGYPEISIRPGTLTAHRIWEGRNVIEHDAEADNGNSGGPVTDKQGRVIGVHTWTAISPNMSTKLAIPSSVVLAWLASDPSSDPKPQRPGYDLQQLLAEAGLSYESGEGGLFLLPYDEAHDNVTVAVHQVQELLRVVVPVGELQAGNGMEALRFDYTDPVGRLSLDPDGKTLYWEAQVPMSFVTPAFLRDLADVGASQAVRWMKTVRGETPEAPDDLYPGGDEAQLKTRLGQVLEQSGLKYTLEEGTYKIPFEEGGDVYVNIYRGVAYIHSYTGGMPGGDEQGMEQAAIELLGRNYEDPLGRLSLDKFNDLCWESQIPMDYLTPDYLVIIAQIGSNQVAEFWKKYGQIPFNEDVSSNESE